MRLKSVMVIVLSLILAALFVSNLKVERASASNTIYIKADGSIIPSSVNITSADNVTYSFTGVVNDSIVIQRDNIMLDGGGYLLNGSGTSDGITMYLGTNVTVSNVRIEGFHTGILFDTCSFCSIVANTITENDWHAIELDSSSSNAVVGNNITANGNRGIMVGYSSYNNVSGNIIDDNYRGLEIEDASQHNTIHGNNITDNNEGMILEYSNHNSITENNITGNLGRGITAGQSSNTTIAGNRVEDNAGYGIILTQSPNCTLVGNNASGNSLGIDLRYTNGTLMRNNTITNNTWNFALDFYSVSDFPNDVDTSNTIEGRPIYYWTDRQDDTVPEDAGMVILYNCTNVTVQSLNISDRIWEGIVIACSTNITIADCRIDIDKYCIWLWNVSGCKINSSYLDGFMGIQLEYSTGNIVYNNTFINSGNFGAINIMQSSGNTFYHNNFTDNYDDVLISEDDSVNNWDNGYPDGGNYWDRYVDRIFDEADEYGGPYQNETGSDGFWDRPYPLDENNTDHYPIVPEYTQTLLLLTFTTTTLLAVAATRRRNKTEPEP